MSRITESRNRREGRYAGLSHFNKKSGLTCRAHHARCGTGAVQRYSLREWSRRP